MTKKFIRVFIIIIGCILLGGCWSYKGLNEVTIVAGVGIDKNKETNGYILSFEIIDLIETNKMEGIRSKVIQSEGETIFEAVRNAKKIISTRLNFSTTQVVIVSEDIVKKEGLYSIINWFAKEAEVRETINFTVAKGVSAYDMISQKGVANAVNTFEMREIIQRDQALTITTRNVLFYQIYNVLIEKNTALVLPTFKIGMTDSSTCPQLDGLAVFKKDKLFKYLTPDESKYYLFIVNQVRGGVVPFSSKNNDNMDITYEVNTSITKINYEVINDKIKFTIKVDTDGFLAEYQTSKKIKSSKEIDKLDKILSNQLKSKIENLIKKSQQENYPDFLELGKKIYNTNYKLWQKEKKNWDNTFKNLDIKVEVDVKIINTAYTK